MVTALIPALKYRALSGGIARISQRSYFPFLLKNGHLRYMGQILNGSAEVTKPRFTPSCLMKSMSLSSVLGKLTVLFLDDSANVISEENIYIYREREVGWEFLFPACLPELPGAGHSCRGGGTQKVQSPGLVQGRQ